MFEEADRNHGSLRMILNCDYGGFGVERAIVAFDQDMVREFQRAVDYEQDFAWRSELDDSLLQKSVLLVAVMVVVVVGTYCVGADVAVAVVIILIVAITVDRGPAELDRNPNRSGFGEESSQSAYDFLFESTSS
jgi:hypothetical protein